MQSEPPFHVPRPPSARDTLYRLYFLDGLDHITHSHEFFAQDDTAATKIAEGWREGRNIELWQSGRRVKRWSDPAAE